MENVNIKSKGRSKKMGRPPGRKGQAVQIYAMDNFLTQVDEWRRLEPDIPSRSEAIRRLVDQALNGRK